MEIQRKIIESYNPPSNKEVWWFDKNEEVLKRWKGSHYEPIISTDSPAEDIVEVPEELKNDYIKIVTYTNDSDAVKAGYQCSVQQVDDGCTWHLYASSPDVMKKSVSMSINTAYSEGVNIEKIYIPNTVETVSFDFCTVSNTQLSIGDIYIGTGVKEIQRRAFIFIDEYMWEEVGLANTKLIVYASEPPILDAEAFIYEPGPENPISLATLTVCVPAAYLDKYKKATNWSMCNLQPIE